MARRKAKPATTHWVWEDYGTRVAFATEVSGLSDAAAIQILRAQRIARVPRNVRVVTITRGTRDVVGLITGTRCVAAVLRDVLEKSTADIQWIPVTVAGARYAIPNALDLVPAIDLATSKVRTFASGAGIAQIERLVPRAIPADAPALFRPAEHTPLWVVGDTLKQRLVSASASPGRFTPLEDYRNEW